MEELYKETTTKMYTWLMATTHKKLDFTILSAGSIGTVTEWLLDNWYGIAYFLVFGIGVIIMKIVKFREDIKFLKRSNLLTLEKQKAQLEHLRRMNKIKEENDSNSEQ
jgi:hypothetical protein